MRFLHATTARIRACFRWALYLLRLRIAGFSERDIAEAFNYLSQMDCGEFVGFQQYGLEVKAWGNEVHLKLGDKKQFVLKQGMSQKRQIYVDEWREEKRAVQLEYGAVHMTNWWEVFRSGSFCTSFLFIGVLMVARREVQRYHELLVPCLKALRMHATCDGDDHVMTDIVFDLKTPGFVMRSEKDRKIFKPISFGEAVELLRPREAA